MIKLFSVALLVVTIATLANLIALLIIIFLGLARTMCGVVMFLFVCSVIEDGVRRFMIR